MKRQYKEKIKEEIDLEEERKIKGKNYRMMKQENVIDEVTGNKRKCKRKMKNKKQR